MLAERLEAVQAEIAQVGELQRAGGDSAQRRRRLNVVGPAVMQRQVGQASTAKIQPQVDLERGPSLPRRVAATGPLVAQGIGEDNAGAILEIDPGKSAPGAGWPTGRPPASG